MTAGKPGVTPSDWARTSCGGVSPPQEFIETRLFVSLGTPVEYQSGIQWIVNTSFIKVLAKLYIECRGGMMLKIEPVKS